MSDGQRFTDEELDWLWSFARGDDPADFEKWYYCQDQLETKLGEHLYLELLSADFASRRGLWPLREQVKSAVAGQSRCECRKIPDYSAIPMGFDRLDESFFSTLERVRHYGEPRWWLDWYGCGKCGTQWLIATDSRHYDDYFLRRLNKPECDRIRQGDWPETFATYEEVLALGKDVSTPPVWTNTRNGSLVWTVADMIAARPGITDSEMAHLMGIPLEDIAVLRSKVSSEPD